MSYSYLDAIAHLRALVGSLPNVDSAYLHRADEFIKSSRVQLDEAYKVLATAHDAVTKVNEELEGDIISQYQYLNHFDEIEVRENENVTVREYEKQKQSRLEPSGFTETNTELHSCAGRIVAKAKALFSETPIKAHVWSYRWYGCEVLSCDLMSLGKEESMPITISATGRQMLDM